MINTVNSQHVRLAGIEALKKKSLSRWFVLALLMVAFFYRAPAYFLGYSWEPPVAFRLGKYVLALILAIGAVNIWLHRIRELTRYDLLYLVAFTLLAVQGFRTNAWDLVEGAFWPLASFAVVRFSQPISARLIGKIVNYTLFAYLIFILLQAGGLVFYDYAFMHAASSIFNSRFGGLTVEPLSAPMLCLVFLGWAIGGQRCHWFYAICVLIFVLMTHTWTSYLYLAIVAVVWGLHELRQGQYRARICGFALFVMVVLVLMAQQLDLYELLSYKRASIELHASYWWPSRWLWLPSEDFKFSETVWVGYIENMGILWTALWVGLLFFMAKSVFDAWKGETDAQLRAIKFASLLVTGYFLFGGLNLPYPAIFPANLIFYLFANLVFFNKIQAMKA